MAYRTEHVCEKGTHMINEDDYVVNDNLFAVIDGATSLVEFNDEDGNSGGRIAADIVKKALETGENLKESVIDANNNLRKAMEESGISTHIKESLWSAAVAAVKIKGSNAECLSIADCVILGIKEDGKAELIIPYHDHDTKTMIEWKRLADRKVKDIWTTIKPLTDKIRRRANIDYGTLNSEDSFEKFIRLKTINIKKYVKIALLSDGMFLPNEDPQQEPDWQKMADIIRAGGPKALLEEVRKLEKSDPLCWKYPRFKQHDDATAVVIYLD